MVDTREQAEAREARRRKWQEALAAEDDAARQREAARLGDEIATFDPEKFERLEPAPGSRGRQAMVALGVAASTVLGAMVFERMGLIGGWSALAAVPVGVGAGLVFGAGLAATASRRAREHRERLVERIRAVAGADRDAAFDLLLRIDDRHELAELARTVHGVLSEAHRDRLEAARLRRDMSQLVERASERSNAKLSKLTVTDELTGLLNRRGFAQALEQAVECCRREQTELVLIAFDLDHFKRLNDNCGHEKGDEAIVAAGQIIGACASEGDFGARIGGDEMFLGLRSSDRGKARRIAERVMELFAQHPAGAGLPVPWPTISAGVACLNADHAGSAADLRRLADEALYASKRAGRGVVSVVPDPLGSGANPGANPGAVPGA